MRIIAGKLKGSILHMPKDKNTRPLKDLARESIFNLLTHSNKILLQIKHSNVLVLGPIGSGKSSFINSLMSGLNQKYCEILKMWKSHPHRRESTCSGHSSFEKVPQNRRCWLIQAVRFCIYFLSDFYIFTLFSITKAIFRSERSTALF